MKERDEFYSIEKPESRSKPELYGISVMDGISIGRVFFYGNNLKKINVTGKIEENEVEAAISRLRKAVNEAFDDIDQTINIYRDTLNSDTKLILHSQKALLSDPEILPQIEELIRYELHSPERAIFEVISKFVDMFENIGNEYWSERSTDIKDTGNRLLKKLAGITGCELADVEEPVIIVADELSAADTVKLDKSKVLAFVTQKGGKTSHTAIFARLMNIPAVIGVENLLSTLTDGELVIVDCARGKIIPSPNEDMIESYKKIQSESQKQFKKYIEKASGAAFTRDNREITVNANIVEPKEAQQAIKFGADGVGMVRTEWLYMNSITLPSEDEQFSVYKDIVLRMNGHGGVSFRTLDIGGDKAVRYLKMLNEENPALGYRGIRLALGKKDIFLTQLRALLRASHFGEMQILLPMITQIEEIFETLDLIKLAKKQLDSEKIPYDNKIKLGVLIETPASVYMCHCYARYVDFFGVGTNDLIQYLLAVDRNNTQVSYLYDYTHPVIHHAIKRIVDVGKEFNKPVSICGDLASDVDYIPVLIGLGVRSISIPVHTIPKAKYKISSYTYEECKQLAESVLNASCKIQIESAIEDAVVSEDFL